MPVDIHVSLPQKEDYRSRARASDDLDWTCTVVRVRAKIDRKAGLAHRCWLDGPLVGFGGVFFAARS